MLIGVLLIHDICVAVAMELPCMASGTSSICFSGGSEKFQDKRQYFYKEICKLSKSSRKEQVIRVSRSNVLEDVSYNYLINTISHAIILCIDNEGDQRIYI